MFAQLKWGRAGREQSLMAAEPSGLAWLGSARRWPARPPGGWCVHGGKRVNGISLYLLPSFAMSLKLL